MKHPIRLGRVISIFASVAGATLLISASLPATSGSAIDERQVQSQSNAVISRVKTTARESPKYESIVLRGNVVELGPYLRERHHVTVDDDAAKDVALVTEAGEVHPFIKDVRSRGFWMDKRLRDRPMELHVHKFSGVPFVRVIDVFSLNDGKKYRVDYWCVICAISTYQPGPCPCCQDEIELRERLVDESKPEE